MQFKYEIERLTDAQKAKLQEIISRFKLENSTPPELSHIKKSIIDSCDIYKCESFSEAKLVLKAYGVNGATDYFLRIHNPSVSNSAEYFAITLCKDSSKANRGLWVELKLSQEILSKLTSDGIVKSSTRKLYDTERHYHVGMSNAKFRTKIIACYQFTKDNLAWYGGDMSCWSEEIVQGFIDIVNKNG